MIHHPTNRAERLALKRRSAEAHSLEKFTPKKINGKKRKIKVQILEKETEDEARAALTGLNVEQGIV